MPHLSGFNLHPPSFRFPPLLLCVLLLLTATGAHEVGSGGTGALPSAARMAGAPAPARSTGFGLFSSHDYIVAAYYFYWYDVFTSAHIVNSNGSDALTDHPRESTPAPLGEGGYAARPPAVYEDPPFFSFQDPAWHAREAQRMAEAGIDVMLPVYWGVPGIEDWSNAGLVQLDRALDALDDRRQRYPAVGLFYDTTTLNGVDLTTPAGKDQFYGTIRDFFSRIRPRRWARVDRRAIVWLYWSGWPSRLDPAVLSQASDRFAADFGGIRLFFVGDEGWRNSGADLDRTYSWGAAVAGPILLETAAIGPGYDDSAVLERPSPTIVPRQGGDFYRSAWQAVHGSGRRLVALETWNEFHEGTEIAPSFEDGSLYWEITRRETVRHHFPAVFVRPCSRHLTGREPDPESFARLTDALSGGAPPSSVLDTVLNSTQARARTPDRTYLLALYRRTLGRRPTRNELADGAAALRRGVPRAALRDLLLDSEEARSRVPDAQFVTEAYRQFLLREPDPAGFDSWMQLLASGAPRAVVRNGFIDSVEFRYRDLSALTRPERLSVFEFTGER